MQIAPRYDGPVVLRFDVRASDPSVPLLRQRRRLAEILAGLRADEWTAPSRCERWSVQDVIAHLTGTNRFWAASIAAGLAGRPTRFLASFDPVATPAQMVDGLRTMAFSDVMAGYVETVDALERVICDLDEAAWSMPAEAPPGHIAVRAVALHALWDAWIHERDVVLPLGLAATVEGDEVAACLAYVAALGPALLASSGSLRRGRLIVEATDPLVSFVVDAGPTVVVSDASAGPPGACLTGDAVALIEGLSLRGPLDHEVAEADRWLLDGLARVFEVRPAASD